MRTIWGVIAAVGAAAFLTLGAIGGCDDQDSGEAHDKAGRHGAGAVARVGFGWRSTAEVRVSVWGFVPVLPQPSPPESGQPETGSRLRIDSLASIRAALDANMLPPHDAVRVADLIGQGLPADPAPEAGVGPPGPQIVLTTTPWNDDTLLLWVAVPGAVVAAGQPVSVEFDPRNVTAFRPLGDAAALPRPEGETGEAAMLYELTASRSDHPRPDLRYAMLHIGPGRAAEQGGAPPARLDAPVSAADFIDSIDDAPASVRFAAATAGFAELLRGDPAVRDLSCGDVINLAEGAAAPDPDGAHARLIVLMHRAQPLIDLPPSQTPPSQPAPAPDDPGK
jgi:hypothetical protein